MVSAAKLRTLQWQTGMVGVCVHIASLMRELPETSPDWQGNIIYGVLQKSLQGLSTLQLSIFGHYILPTRMHACAISTDE